jgi:hypothetical protein
MCAVPAQDTVITVRAWWLPIVAGVCGALLGVGCGWFWQSFVDYVEETCALVKDELSLCEFNLVIWAPVAIVVAAVASFVITWAVLAAFGARPWSYTLYAAPTVTVLAAFAWHAVATGKILVAAVVLGFGLAAVAVVDQWRESRAEAAGRRLAG